MSGAVSPNPYLAPDSICSSCCKTRGRRQLIKVGVVTQSYLRALSVSIRDSFVKQIVTRGRQLTKVVLWAPSLGTGGPLPHSGLGMKAQFQGFLSQIVGMLHRISRTSLLSC